MNYRDRWRNRPRYPVWKLTLDLLILACAASSVAYVLYCSM